MSIRRLEEVGEELGRWATSGLTRIPTGYPLYDSRTNGGIAPGEVFLFLARTSVGKTWWALNVIANQDKTTPMVFFSLEMHARYILQRLAGIVSNTPTIDIERSLSATGEAPGVKEAEERYPMLAIEDEPGLSVRAMSLALEEYADNFGQRARLAVVDYMELVKSPGMSQVESVDKLGWALKDFARKEDIALVVLHQVKRGDGNQGHMPLSMTDARFGGEMSADYVAGAFRPCLNPGLGQDMRVAMEDDFRLQFLKTRSSGGIYPDGVRHYFDTQTGSLVPMPSDLPSGQLEF